MENPLFSQSRQIYLFILIALLTALAVSPWSMRQNLDTPQIRFIYEIILWIQTLNIGRFVGEYQVWHVLCDLMRGLRFAGDFKINKIYDHVIHGQQDLIIIRPIG